MFNKLKLCQFLIILFIMNAPITFIFLTVCNAQENYLLTKNDLPDHTIDGQSTIHWAVNKENQILEGIGQNWKIAGTDQEIVINYCKFNNAAEAFQSTAYAAIKSNALPYIWGSPNGSIVADGSWMAIGGGAIYFVRGNIGIKIFKPKNFNKNDIILVNSISSKLATKIDTNLEKNIISNEERVKQKQISMTEFNKIIESVISLKKMNNLSSSAAWDSKWIIDSENMAMGVRKEWTSGKSLTIGIDICQFNTEENTIKASEILSKNTYLYDRLVHLDELNSLTAILNDWQKKWISGIPKSFFSVVGIKGNRAVHVYFYDESGIETDFMYSLFERLSKKM